MSHLTPRQPPPKPSDPNEALRSNAMHYALRYANDHRPGATTSEVCAYAAAFEDYLAGRTQDAT